MPPTQENRSMRITTPLADNDLLLTMFSGTEGLSMPFSFELTLVSESNSLAFDQIIGKDITVSLGEKKAIPVILMVSYRDSPRIPAPGNLMAAILWRVILQPWCRGSGC